MQEAMKAILLNDANSILYFLFSIAVLLVKIAML